MNSGPEIAGASPSARDTVCDVPVLPPALPAISDTFELPFVRELRARYDAWQHLVALRGDLCQALTQVRPLRENLQQCMTALVRHLDVAFARIWTLDASEPMLVLQASSGEPIRLDGRYSRIAVGRLRVGIIAQTAHPYLSNNFAEDARIEDRDWARHEEIVSFAGQPLLADGQVVGVLAVFGRKALPSTTLDELAIVADLLAQYVKRQRTEWERAALLERERGTQARGEEAVRRSAFLTQVSLALDACLDCRATVERMALLAIPTLADWCLIDVVEEGGVLRRFASAGEPDWQPILDELARRVPVKRHASQPAALVLQTGEALVFPDCTDIAALLGPPQDAEHERLLRSLESRSLMAVPLQARGQLLGVITFVSTTLDRRYGDADLLLARDFARRCSLTLDNVHLVECAHHEAAERRWAEEALLRSQEHLRQAQKLDALGRLAGGIAHDFNNVLMAIMGYAELLLHQLPAGREHEEVKGIWEAGDRAAQLTRQLLTFGRKQPAVARVVDLNGLLENLRGMLARLLGEDLSMRMTLDSSLGLIRVDSGQIEQAIINLVVNARDAMSSGGQLVVETRNVELDRSWEHLEVNPGPYVLLAIRDTGHGMTEEVKAHLYEPFFTTKEPGKGTGLGLAITYGIIRQAGGHIDVETEPGKGTTFYVYLPRVSDEERPPAPSATAAAAPCGTETLLLAEDDEVIRGLLSRALRASGYRVLEASDGEEALVVSDGQPIDLLVTDVVMPRLGGRELAGRLLETRPDLRVLYLSGYTDVSMFGGGPCEEGHDFLEKPFALEALARKIREILDRAADPDRGRVAS